MQDVVRIEFASKVIQTLPRILAGLLLSSNLILLANPRYLLRRAIVITRHLPMCARRHSNLVAAARVPTCGINGT